MVAAVLALTVGLVAVVVLVLVQEGPRLGADREPMELQVTALHIVLVVEEVQAG
jgi:hypothetical protein